MAFRKRNVPLGQPRVHTALEVGQEDAARKGIRPSTQAALAVTSTGAPSLDGLLGGHGGLALGTSLLIEESGTTDFAGTLLRYYAAEGLCHDHVLHVVGVGEGWIRELPGVAEPGKSGVTAESGSRSEKMKIAWRYEKLGQPGERGTSATVKHHSQMQSTSYFRSSLRSSSTLMVGTASSESSSRTSNGSAHPQEMFCHTFDLTKRLAISRDAKVNHITITSKSPFESVYRSISSSLSSTPPNSIHRVVIPSILSPVIYPSGGSRPESFLEFLRSLRSLLHENSNRLTAMISLPLELYPRNLGLVRWAEILSDGVMTLTPFPHLMDSSNNSSETRSAKAIEEQPQGMVTFHKLPINTERGEGGAGAGNSIAEDLSFTVSRRKFVIKPFSLPPIEGDQGAQKDAGALTAKDIEF